MTKSRFVKVPRSTRWKLGHKVTMRDAYGKGHTEGQLVERHEYSVMIRLRDGSFLCGSTSLLEPPTGEKWEETDDMMKVKKGSWDLMEAACIRRGDPIPEFKSWLPNNGLGAEPKGSRKRRRRRK